MKPKKILQRARTSARIAALAAQGLSGQMIAEKLNSEGYLTPQGKLWTQPNVARILRLYGWRPAFARRPRVNGPGAVAPLVTDIHQQADDLDGLAVLLSNKLRARFSESGAGLAEFSFSGRIEDLHALLMPLVVKTHAPRD